MDVRFCEGRDQSREAPMRAEDLDQEDRALASAPGHVCSSLTEDLHGCRTSLDETDRRFQSSLVFQRHAQPSCQLGSTLARVNFVSLNVSVTVGPLRTFITSAGRKQAKQVPLLWRTLR